MTMKEGEIACDLDTRAALIRLGLPLPPSVRVASTDQVEQVAGLVAGPWFVKGMSSHFPHKTEHGLVEGPLASVPDLAAAVERVRDALYRLDSQGSVMVEQATEAAFEWMVSYVRDPILGGFVHLGVGGTFVELVRDVATVPVPVDERSCARLLQQLRHGVVADGFRGRVPDHRKSLIAMLCRLSSPDLFRAFGSEVLALELNPVGVDRSGALMVLDAVAITRSSDQSTPGGCARESAGFEGGGTHG